MALRFYSAVIHGTKIRVSNFFPAKLIVSLKPEGTFSKAVKTAKYLTFLEIMGRHLSLLIKQIRLLGLSYVQSTISK